METKACKSANLNDFDSLSKPRKTLGKMSGWGRRRECPAGPWAPLVWPPVPESPLGPHALHGLYTMPSPPLKPPALLSLSWPLSGYIVFDRLALFIFLLEYNCSSALCAFCCPASWVSQMCTDTPSRPALFSHPPSQPSRSSQSTELSTLALKPSQASTCLCLASASFLVNGSWPRPTPVWSWAFWDTSPRAGASRHPLASKQHHLSPSPPPWVPAKLAAFPSTSSSAGTKCFCVVVA